MAERPPRPRVLTIAGSDSGGGAGIQADLKTFAALGAYGMSALTAVTAQNTLGVTAVHEIPAAVVVAQIDAVFSDLGVDGVKIGMLANAPIVRAVAAALRAHHGPPVVLDPVMVAKSGDPLLAEDAVAALGAELLPVATLVTPNLPEAEKLAGSAAGSPVPPAFSPSLARRRELARALGERAAAVLLKGGHAPGEEIVDLLWDGRELREFRHPRLATRATHGTGCTLSSAIAVGLARGEELGAAVGAAIDYLQGAIAAAPPLGRGAGPVDHLYRLP